MTVTLLLVALGASQSVDFDRDVRPILSESCFACHGPDEGSRAASLRLDTREGALQDLGGYAAIVPGDAEGSELIARVESDFEFELMPPPESHKAALDKEDIDVLRRWIDDGAPWARHWAFVPPTKAALQPGAAHPIDALVAGRLAARDLSLSPAAAPHTLARRIAFDLTGLPPEPEAIERLANGADSAAFDAYVDELLASPHYAERMAMWWLDGARYADSDGFQADDERRNWPWRDWVVEAFDSGMPFDEFTRQQLAGDLGPHASESSILATCFQRNHMHNGEGGRDPAESRVDYVRDRVNTLGTVFLGLTLECAQCHDHKFDPVSQADYYSLTAFFNSIDEDGRAGRGAKPFLEVTSPRAQPALELAKRELADAEAHMKRVRAGERDGYAAWLAARRAELALGRAPWMHLDGVTLSAAEGTPLRWDDDAAVLVGEPNPLPQDEFSVSFDAAAMAPRVGRIAGLQLEVFAGESGKPGLAEDGEFILTGIKVRVTDRATGIVRDVPLVHTAASLVGEGTDKQYGHPRGLLGDDPRTGWTTRGKEIDGVARVVAELGEPLVLAEGEDVAVVLLHRATTPGALMRRFRISVTAQRGEALRSVDPTPLEELAALGPDGLAAAPELDARLYDQFLEDRPAWRDAQALLERFRAQKSSAQSAAGPLAVTVLKERAEARKTFVLERGVWDQHGDVVTSGFPSEIFPSPDFGGESPTRADLAAWVTDRENPLTARAVANQIWQLFFGRGLVRTPADLGLQGDRPEYPELLDWLAVDFMESGWDVRHLVRRIVTSRTYRQTGAAAPGLVEADPSNEWLARGPRFRLPSWMIRDAALAASGLLDRTLGGPPVYPHQPPGVWRDVFIGRYEYKPTVGRARFRRTLYAFWKRNAAPTFLFDMADRRTCAVDRRLTNTPLQALTLLNDRTLLEAALGLATATAAGELPDAASEVQAIARAVLSRALEPDELEVALRLHAASLEAFRLEPERAAELAAPSKLALPPRTGDEVTELPRPTVAALTVVANMILNLDEAITHE